LIGFRRGVDEGKGRLFFIEIIRQRKRNEQTGIIQSPSKRPDDPAFCGIVRPNIGFKAGF